MRGICPQAPLQGESHLSQPSVITGKREGEAVPPPPSPHPTLPLHQADINILQESAQSGPSPQGLCYCLAGLGWETSPMLHLVMLEDEQGRQQVCLCSARQEERRCPLPGACDGWGVLVCITHITTLSWQALVYKLYLSLLSQRGAERPRARWHLALFLGELSTIQTSCLRILRVNHPLGDASIHCLRRISMTALQPDG